MKICSLLFILLFVSGQGFCQSAKNEKRDEKSVVVAVEKNKKYGITATFYGEDLQSGNDKERVTKIIRYIIFRQQKTGGKVKYMPTDSAETQATDFYYTGIWSPDEEYAVLPIGKKEGFGIIKAKNALQDIKSHNFYNQIKVGGAGGGFFWHDFGKWEDDSTFSFRAGLDGDMFAFGYNAAKSELYCYRERCEELNAGTDGKGSIKPVKKGDIETIKKY